MDPAQQDDLASRISARVVHALLYHAAGAGAVGTGTYLRLGVTSGAFDFVVGLALIGCGAGCLFYLGPLAARGQRPIWLRRLPGQSP